MCRFKIPTQKPLETRNLGVRDLMDKDNGCWNFNIINRNFNPIDKEEITTIQMTTIVLELDTIG